MTHSLKHLWIIILSLCAMSLSSSAAVEKAGETSDTVQTYVPPFELKMIGRTYGDKILLRWAPTEYAPWRLLNDYGYCLLRVSRDERLKVDTVAACLRPLSLQALKEQFAAQDSLAGAAAQLLYEHGTPLSAVSGDGMSGVMEVYEEQQSRFAYAMLLAEFRADLARAMGLMYEDRAVKQGLTYEYILRPLTPDSVVRIRPTSLSLVNSVFHRDSLQVQLHDSIVGMGKLLLSWRKHKQITAYDIERRENGGKWLRLNSHPFITLLADDDDQTFSYTDQQLHAANYEYRLVGYDSFGEKTLPSAVHQVAYPELRTPSAPQLKRFVIYDQQRADNKAFADIVWQKDTIEKDMTGYDIYYFHAADSAQWVKLNDALIPPGDTLYRAEITNLPAGYILVKAYNSYGNASASIPYEINIVDRTAPSQPQGLKYIMSPQGVVYLHWNACSDKDIKGYQVFAANDTTHLFQPLRGGLLRDTVATDTLSMAHINQRYIYYRVAAYDYAGNTSPLSDILQVERLNYHPPLVCRIDSTWQHKNHIHMRWLASPNKDVAVFRLYRKHARSKKWTLLRTIAAQHVENGKINLEDSLTHTAIKDKYYYCMEAINATGISSGLSLPVVFNIRLPRTIHIAPTLTGHINAQGQAQLQWTLPQAQLPPHYFVLEWDKGQGEGQFNYVESIVAQRRSTLNAWISKGQRVAYRLLIYFKDGRRSLPSNVVSLTRPKATENRKEVYDEKE